MIVPGRGRPMKTSPLSLFVTLTEGVVDSGVHLRNQDQIQTGISGSLKRGITGSPYISDKGYPVEATGVNKLLKMTDWNPDWNHMRIEVPGMEYACWLNGKKVMTYTSDTGLPKGPIGLQMHGDRDMAIDYRNINLAEL